MEEEEHCSTSSVVVEERVLPKNEEKLLFLEAFDYEAVIISREDHNAPWCANECAPRHH